MERGGTAIVCDWNDRRKKRATVRRTSNVRMARGRDRNALGYGHRENPGRERWTGACRAAAGMTPQCIGRETVGLRNAVPPPNSTLCPFGQETAAREALGHNPSLGPCTGVTPEWRTDSLAGVGSPRDRPEHPIRTTIPTRYAGQSQPAGNASELCIRLTRQRAEGSDVRERHPRHVYGWQRCIPAVGRAFARPSSACAPA